ncbi:hypothetical protein [Amycolatopsis pigmentata]|uniref:Major Facilitator Superfamily protein n=1 Tax=Amycolatopsis pigmentata TaxID=450801 RepID=A0ABW5G354_9PSEU
MIGFAAGGVLAQYTSWRMIFALGAVLVFVALWLVWRRGPESAARAEGRFDTKGAVVSSISAITLLGGLTLATSSGWTSPATIGLLVVAAVAALMWIRHERSTENPLVDLGVLADRRVAVVNLLGAALMAVVIPARHRSPEHVS